MDLARLRRFGNVGSLRFSASASPPIAIEFGAGSLKVLQVGPGDPPCLISAACVTTPDELLADPARRLAFQIEALPDLIKSADFKGKRAVCAIPAGHTVVKHMQAVRAQGVPLADTVAQALCVQLGCAPGSVLVRHTEVDVPGRSGPGAKSEVICIAAARELVNGLVKAIKDARLEPVGIHSEPRATLRAFEHINRRDEDRHTATLYLDIGATTTNLTIGHAHDLVFARKLDFGGHLLDKAISAADNCTIADARARRLAAESIGPRPASPAAADRAGGAPEHAEPGSTGIPALDAIARADAAAQPEQDPASVGLADDRREGRPAPGLSGAVLEQPARPSGVGGLDLSEPLDILTDEIAMCLRYHASLFPDTPLARAIFVGGEARHLGLCQHVARAVRLPAQVADPMARVTREGGELVVGVDLASSQPGWTVPLGLCLCPTDL